MKFIYLHGFASSPLSRKAQFFGAKLREEGASVEIPYLESEGFRNLSVSGQIKVIEESAAGEAVRIIGSSMGGYLAALYAALHPETEKIVLLAPAFGFAERWKLRLGDTVMEQWKSKGTLEMMHYASGRMEPVGYQLIEDGLRYPAEPAFAQPALIFHGAQDDIVPLSFSEQFVATRANALLTVVESGHELTDAMERIWRESRDFLLT